MILGLDVGSSKLKALLLDKSLAVIDRWTIKNRGDAEGSLSSFIDKILQEHSHFSLKIGVTGSGHGI
jgi:activator of 2-hydroxyglutaryl-CoA dehydratase